MCQEVTTDTSWQTAGITTLCCHRPGWCSTSLNNFCHSSSSSSSSSCGAKAIDVGTFANHTHTQNSIYINIFVCIKVNYCMTRRCLFPRPLAIAYCLITCADVSSSMVSRSIPSHPSCTTQSNRVYSLPVFLHQYMSLLLWTSSSQHSPDLGEFLFLDFPILRIKRK